MSFFLLLFLQQSICRSPSEGDLSSIPLRPVGPPLFKDPSLPVPGQPSTDSGLADAQDDAAADHVDAVSQSVHSSTLSDDIDDKQCQVHHTCYSFIYNWLLFFFFFLAGRG